MRIVILGAGDMGSAIATPAAANGHDVCIWGTQFDQQIVDLLRAGKPHPRLNHTLPDGLTIYQSDQLATALHGADIVVLAITSPAVDSILDLIAPHLTPNMIIVSMAKGLVRSADGKVRLISDRVAHRTGCLVVGVGGPAKANEVGLGLPTAAIFGGTSPSALNACKDAFDTPTYSVEVTDDLIGVELGAALKNAYAIAVGVASGMEESSGLPYQNFKAALIQEAAVELAAIVEICGGRPETIYGLAGFGDLVVTVAAGRNRLLGEMLGRGTPIVDALSHLSATGLTIEGYTACELGYQLIVQHSTEPERFPLLVALYRILYQEAPVFDSLWAAVRA